MASFLVVCLKMVLVAVWLGAIGTLFIPALSGYELVGYLTLAMLVMLHGLECCFFFIYGSFRHLQHRWRHGIAIFIFGAFHLIPLLRKNQ